MAYRYTAASSKRMVNAYTREIEKLMKRIRKDFNDMDFENASAKNDMDAIVCEIETNCKNLINEISSFSFN